MNLLDATTEFHTLADLPTAEWVEPGQERCVGGQLPMTQRGWNELRCLRVKLQREEMKEYTDAEEADDIVEIVDGLLDTIVVAWGTLLAYVGPELAGLAATAVAESNLSKVDGSLGETVRRDDGKLLKPEGWTPPNIKGVLGL